MPPSVEKPYSAGREGEWTSDRRPAPATERCDSSNLQRLRALHWVFVQGSNKETISFTIDPYYGINKIKSLIKSPVKLKRYGFKPTGHRSMRVYGTSIKEPL